MAFELLLHGNSRLNISLEVGKYSSIKLPQFEMQEKIIRFENNLSLIMTALRKKTSTYFLCIENARIIFPIRNKKVAL